MNFIQQFGVFFLISRIISDQTAARDNSEYDKRRVQEGWRWVAIIRLDGKFTAKNPTVSLNIPGGNHQNKQMAEQLIAKMYSFQISFRPVAFVKTIGSIEFDMR